VISVDSDPLFPPPDSIFTTILHVAVLEPHVAVIVHDPFALDVTFPD
jgi:hypothetical protein